MLKNKKIKSVIIGLLALGALPMVSAGFNVGGNPQPNPQVVNATAVMSLINFTVDLVWWIFVAGVVILFMLAGLSFLTAMGDATKLEKARNFAIWGVVGVFVGIIGFAVISLIRVWFGGL